MSNDYVVNIACLVHVPVVTAQGDSFATLYEGDTVPAGVPQDKLDFWLDGGMIRKAGQTKAEAKDKDEVPAGNGGQDPEPKPALQAPPTSGAGSGQKAWAEYAIANGMDSHEANAASREALIAAYGPKSE